MSKKGRDECIDVRIKELGGDTRVTGYGPSLLPVSGNLVWQQIVNIDITPCEELNDGVVDVGRINCNEETWDT